MWFGLSIEKLKKERINEICLFTLSFTITLSLTLTLTLTLSAFLGSGKKAWVIWVSSFLGLPPFKPFSRCLFA